jgi:hypothetical protein
MARQFQILHLVRKLIERHVIVRITRIVLTLLMQQRDKYYFMAEKLQAPYFTQVMAAAQYQVKNAGAV